MKTTTTHAAAAAEIRRELKRHGIKATVRSSSFSMGNTVAVRIEQDLLPDTLEQIHGFCAKYRNAHFASNRRSDIPQVKWLSVDVQWSDEIIAEAKQFAVEHELPENEYWRLLSGRSLWSDEFWSPTKPRQRAA